MGVNIYEEQNVDGKSKFIEYRKGYSFGRVSPLKIVQDGYMGNEDVYSMVSRFARLCASTKIILMNGDKPVPDTDPIYKFWYDDWNHKQGGNTAKEALFTNLLLQGTSYTWKKTESFGFAPKELWVLPSQYVSSDVNTRSFFETPRFYEFYDGVTRHKYLPDELIVLKYYDPNDITSQLDGLSPLQSVWNTVISGNNRAVAESSMLENRGISGFVSPKSTGEMGAMGFTNTAMDAVRKVFAALTGGAKKFNKVEVLDQATEFTQLGMTADDMKIIEMRLNHVRAICNTYGLPSILFNDYQSRTHANYKEAMKALYTDAVIPQLNLFINVFEKELFNEINEATGAKYWLRVAVEEIEALKEDLAQLRQSVLLQLEKNLITKKEAREMLGLPADMNTDSMTAVDRLLSMSPVLVNDLIATLSEDDRNALLKQIGLIK